jgi:hypothetical protein
MDLLNVAKGILGAVAPTVATALGGPLAGVAVRQIGSALGLSDNATQDEVMSAVANADPETLSKIKQVEADFKVKMKELDVSLAKLEVEDKNSARNREVQTKDKTPRVLAYLIVALYIGVQVYLITGNIIPAEMREMVMRALGTLDAILGGIFAYYFGSSVGSKEKSNQLDQLIAGNKDGK